MADGSKQNDGRTAGRSFVLRVWPASAGADPALWRITLWDTESGLRRGFASLEELTLFMEAVCTEIATR